MEIYGSRNWYKLAEDHAKHNQSDTFPGYMQSSNQEK